MKFWHLYEEEKDRHDDVVGVVYRYDWLIGEDGDDDNNNNNNKPMTT